MVDPKHTEAIRKAPIPRNVGEVRSLYGILNHIRDHIPHLSEKAKPILDLLKKSVKFEFTPERIKAFEYVKEAMCNLAELQLPRDDLPWVLKTDASGKALGAVIYQKYQGNVLKPVSYASRTLMLEPNLGTSMDKSKNQYSTKQRTNQNGDLIKFRSHPIR